MIIHVTLFESFFINNIVPKNRSSNQMVSYPFQPLGEFRVHSLKFFDQHLDQQRSCQSDIITKSRKKTYPLDCFDPLK